MKKYEKLIVITLIFIMLFNIVQVRELSADFDNLTRAGLVAFIILMNIYNVSVMSRDVIMTLFNDFWLSKTTIEQNQFVNSFKSVWQNSFTSGIMSVVSMPMIHSWIRENFKKGYNSKIINEKDITNVITDSYTSETFYVVNLDDNWKKYYSYNGNLISIEREIENNFFRLYINGERKRTIQLYGSSFFYVQLYKDSYRTNCSISYNVAGGNYSVSVPMPLEFGNYEIEEDEEILYYAGEAVDYPMEKEVEDKYIPLPVPDVGMGIPGFDYDVGGNRVFDGTVDQFLDGALDNADYLDSTIDKLIEGGYATSQPYVNVDAGTITWPATGVTYPDTGVIDYPDVTIPEGVVEGIGETNSILQGIGSFVESIFSAPTVELDLSPLTNVNLKEKFPFCLPFDLAMLITGLSSKDKEIPIIDYEFTVFNESYSIPIDFTIFSDWAIIVNWFVLVLFIIGLVLISRKLIGG